MSVCALTRQQTTLLVGALNPKPYLKFRVGVLVWVVLGKKGFEGGAGQSIRASNNTQLGWGCRKNLHPSSTPNLFPPSDGGGYG